MYDDASKLYNEYLGIYFDEYKSLSDAQKRELGNKYDLINSFFETYNYDVWFENKESTHQKESVDLSDISPLECDEGKVKEGK